MSYVGFFSYIQPFIFIHFEMATYVYIQMREIWQKMLVMSPEVFHKSEKEEGVAPWIYNTKCFDYIKKYDWKNSIFKLRHCFMRGH